MKSSNDTIWNFFAQWSFIGQDIVSTFASLYCQGKHLLVLCLDTSPQRQWRLMLPVYLLGLLRCVCIFFLSFLGRCRLLWRSCVDVEVLRALDASTW
jgi:hypothetical protein